MALAMRDTERLLICTVYCLISLIFGLEASVFGPTANLLARQTHVTEEQLAPVLGCSGFLMIIGGYPSGWLMDKFKGNHVLVGSLVIQTLGFIVMPLCSSVALLTMTYGLVSMTFTCVNTGVNCLVIRLFTDPETLETDSKTIGAWLNTISVLFGVGGLIVPQVVNLCAWLWEDGAIYSYYLIAALAGSTVVLTWMIPHVEEPTAVHGTSAVHNGGHAIDDDTLSAPLLAASSDSCSHIPKHITPDADLPSNAPSVLRDPKHVQQRMQRQKTPWLFFSSLLLIVFSNIGLELGVGGWIFTYGTDFAHMTPLQARQLTSLYWMVFTLGRIPAIFLASCVHLSTIMITSMPLVIIGAAIPLLLREAIISNPVLLPAAIALIGAGIAPAFPCSLSYATEYVAINGQLNGVLSIAAGVGATVIPFIIPWLADQSFTADLGFQWLMIVTLLAGFVQLGGLILMFVTARWLRSDREGGVEVAAVGEGVLSPLLTPPADVERG